MIKRVTGLAGKLTVGIVLFGILLGTASSIIGYREFTSVLEQQYNDSAYEICLRRISKVARQIKNMIEY